MNKDFWKRIDKLEELANKVEVKDWVYSAGFGKPAIIAENGCYGVQIAEAVFGGKASDIEYIAAANPAMILEMIAEMKKLAKKLNDQKAHIGRQAERIKVLEEDRERLREAYRKEKQRLIVEFHASEESGADLEQLKRIVNLQTEIKACQQSLGGFCSGHDREYWLEAARKATEEK